MAVERLTKFEKKFSEYELGRMYEFGRPNVAVDFDKANYWYQRAYKKEKRDYALLAIARIALHKKDKPKLAFAIYEKLSAKKISSAYVGLGEIYDAGSLGVRDVKKARESYKKAYDLGEINAYASYQKLGQEAESGNGLFRRFYCFLSAKFTLKKSATKKIVVELNPKSVARKSFKAKAWMFCQRLPGLIFALHFIFFGWTTWHTGNVYNDHLVFDAGRLAKPLAMILIFCGFYMLHLAIKSLSQVSEN